MSQSQAPQITVIVPAFNCARTIKRALDSVTSQTFTDYETIIVDDGSSDDTQRIIETLEITNLRVIRHSKNRGAAAARNTGISSARGRWIAFLDSDDAWRREKLARQVAPLQTACVNAPACTTGFILHKNGFTVSSIAPLRTGQFKREILFGCTTSPGSTLLVERRIFDQVGLFDDLLQRLEDWDWLLRFARHHDIVSIPEPLVDIYLRNRDSTEIGVQAQAVLEAINRIEEKQLSQMDTIIKKRQLRSSLMIERAATMYRSHRRFQAGLLVVLSLFTYPFRNAEFFRMLWRSWRMLTIRH